MLNNFISDAKSDLGRFFNSKSKRISEAFKRTFHFTVDEDKIPPQVFEAIKSTFPVNFENEQLILCCWSPTILMNPTEIIVVTYERVIVKNKLSVYQHFFKDVTGVHRDRFGNVLITSPGHTTKAFYDRGKPQVPTKLLESLFNILSQQTIRYNETRKTGNKDRLSVSVVEQLEKLASLKEKGHITEEEFITQKRALFSHTSASPQVKATSNANSVNQPSDRRKASYVAFVCILVGFTIWRLGCNKESQQAQDIITTNQVSNDNHEAANGQILVGEKNEVYYDPNGTRVYPQIQYQIKYKYTNLRYDEQPHFLVLMEPVRLETDEFKKDVRKIVAHVINKYGKGINVDVFDDLQVLETVNASDEIDKNNGRKLSKKEYSSMSRHNIALYTGGIDLGTAGQYNLSFFPSSWYGVKEVEQYRSDENFEPMSK